MHGDFVYPAVYELNSFLLPITIQVEKIDLVFSVSERILQADKSNYS